MSPDLSGGLAHASRTVCHSRTVGAMAPVGLKRSHGFTLIRLLLVVAIIGIRVDCHTVTAPGARLLLGGFHHRLTSCGMAQAAYATSCAGGYDYPTGSIAGDGARFTCSKRPFIGPDFENDTTNREGDPIVYTKGTWWWRRRPRPAMDWQWASRCRATSSA